MKKVTFLARLSFRDERSTYVSVLDIYIYNVLTFDFNIILDIFC